MIQPFVIIYNFIRKKRSIFLVVLLTVVLLAGYLASMVRLEEDIFKMVLPEDDTSHYTEALSNTKLLDYLVVRIYNQDTASHETGDLIIYADGLKEALDRSFDSSYIRKIQYKINRTLMNDAFDEFSENLPIFLGERDYQYLDSILSNEHIKNALENNYRTLVSPASIAMKKYLVKDPLGITSRALKKLESFQPDDGFVIQSGRIFTRDGNNLLMLISPANPSSETSKNATLVKGIGVLIDSLNTHTTYKAKAEYFGGVAVSVANAERIKKDVALTVGIALLVVILLMVFYFRQKRIVPVLVLPAVFGVTMALALLFLIKGSLSGIALGVGAVLVGIAIDYALHFFTHYQSMGSVRKVLKDITIPILLSCITTSAAFLCLGLVSSEALRDMGWFAALSIVFAALFTLLVLPHLIREKTSTNQRTFLNRFASYDFHKNWYLKSGIVAITILTLFYYKNAAFEEDLERMSYKPEYLAKAEENLNAISTVSLRTMYVVSVGNSMDEALEANGNLGFILNDLNRKGVVKSYLLPSDLRPSRSQVEKKLKEWNLFWEDRHDSVTSWIRNNAVETGFKKDAFQDFTEVIKKDFSNKDHWDLPVIQTSFLNDYINLTDNGAYVVTTIKLEPDDRKRVHEALEYLPGQVIIDKQYLANRFVDMLRSDFNQLVMFSMLIVFLIILLALGRIELTMVTYLPMLVSWIWTLGIMGILGIKFTIFNVVITTFIFGLGIDYSVFITRGLLQEFKSGERNLGSFKTSILLSAITTIAGVGVLIFAVHPALKSIALVSVIGIFSVVINAYTLQPMLFYWLIRQRGEKRFAPITLIDFGFSLMALVIFVSGTLIITFLGIVLFYVLPMSKRKARYIYHFMIMMAFRVVIYGPVNISKKIIGFNKKKFRKPSVIIANHQSHIDILLVLMLYPKVLVLTNQKVHRRIYGFLVKMADFYAISDGMDQALPGISERVKEGYSVLIFPEGTRSDNTYIQRFHRGAFYLAEQLGLDVLPVIFHGVGDALKKGELFLRSGKITMKILERVSQEDLQYGKGYRERSKGFRKYIKEQYKLLEEEYGQASYFRRRMKMNYVYRGPVLEWYLKVKLRMEENYKLFDQYVPHKGLITDLGCGYGFISYLLSFRSVERTILGIDYDSDKVEVAKHAYYKNENLRFTQGDIRKKDLRKSDAFILSDVLHYLPESDQERLLDKCAGSLNEGGVILIREGDKALKGRHKATRFSELLSTRIVRFNKTDETGELHFTSEKQIRDFAERIGLQMEIIDHTKYTSNLLFVLSKPYHHKELSIHAAI